MMVAGCVSVTPRCLRGEKLFIPRSVLDLLFDVLLKAKHREMGIVFARFVGGRRSLHQRNSSMSELVCSSGVYRD